MSRLHVRGLYTKEHEAVPDGILGAVCERAIDVLARQGLTAIKDYEMRMMRAEGLVKPGWKREEGQRIPAVFFDGNSLMKRYAGSRDPYLFVAPEDTLLAAGPERGLAARECIGYGEDNAMLLSMRVVGPEEPGFVPRFVVSDLLHEIGHAVYVGSHHRKLDGLPCSMRPEETTALRYCSRHLAIARKVDEGLQAS